MAEVIRLIEHKEKNLVARVDALIRYGAYEEAIQCCDKFIETNPLSHNIFFIKHRLLITTGKYEESLRDANKMLFAERNKRKVLFLKLDSMSHLLNGSRLRLVSADYREKWQYYVQEFEKTSKEALFKYKGDTQITYMITQSYQLMGRKIDAIELLGDHLKRKPRDVHYLYQLGLIYQEVGKFKKALECYNRSLRSIEEYSPILREHFSKLISESRDQMLKKISNYLKRNLNSISKIK